MEAFASKYMCENFLLPDPSIDDVQLLERSLRAYEHPQQNTAA